MISSTAPSIIGLDIGGTKLACVEGTVDGNILGRQESPTQASEPFEKRFPAVVAMINSRLTSARAAGREVIALSVSVGGPLRISEGFLLNPPHLPGWHGVRLKDRLAAAFPQLPVFVEHDGNAGALAEFHFGVGRGRTDLRHLIFLTFGTGLGAGCIVNGKILHGASDTAGEVGHWRLSKDGPIGFGKTGSWEGFCSGAGLVLVANRLFPSRWSPETPIRDLVEAMLFGDADAITVANEAGRRMGQGLALLIDAFNPQVIVLGSLAVVLGERILGPARQMVMNEALPQAAAACKIVPSVLGSQIGDLAALMAALTDPTVGQRHR
ncbi:MAG: ROK family protein [Steroidobacteraceae bacterium]